MAYEFVPHVFAQGHTIEGAIRLHNSLNMLTEHVDLMVEEFNKINAGVFPPVAGQVVKIPVMAEYKFDELVPEPAPRAPKVEPDPVIEAPTPTLPPLRQPMKPRIRQIPKKREPNKVPTKPWWK